MEISQVRQARIRVVEKILENEENQINTQYYFKRLIMEKMHCREHTARKMLKEAIDYGRVIPVTEMGRRGNSGGRGSPIHYILPIIEDGLLEN